MKIAVTGATGQLGRLLIERLRAKLPATDIVALARTPAKAADLGVEVREADYARPETLDQALAGIDTLMLISGSEVGQQEAQHRNLIEAAKQASMRLRCWASRCPTSLPEISIRVSMPARAWSRVSGRA